MHEWLDTTTPTEDHVTDRCELDVVDAMTSSPTDRRHVLAGCDVITNGAMQVYTAQKSKKKTREPSIEVASTF